MSSSQLFFQHLWQIYLKRNAVPLNPNKQMQQFSQLFPALR